MREGEIGVIESWVSTYFVIGATENLFCNAPRGENTWHTASTFKFVDGFQRVRSAAVSVPLRRIVQRMNARVIRFEADFLLNWLPD